MNDTLSILIFTFLVNYRMIFALLGCFGFAIIFGLNVNMSVAIVAMVNHTAVNSLQPNTTTLNIEDNSVEDTTNVSISFPSKLKSC